MNVHIFNFPLNHEELHSLPSPCYLIDEGKLIANLEILKSIQNQAGCKILLAQKAFSMYSTYPLIGKYLSGTTASSLFEARLGFEEMTGKEVHIFSPAFLDSEFDQVLNLADHIVFNSFSQWRKFRYRVQESQKKVSCGIRINPECSTQEGHAIYDPCSPGSRLGVTLENFREEDLEGIEGLHFHTLCEQNSDALQTTLKAVEAKFGKYLSQMKWINFGGGHHITRDDYDRELLIKCITEFKQKYGVAVYLEPGEAIALNAGFLVTSVLDTLKSTVNLAILDASAACHMPDVLEMPYRPRIIGSGLPGEKASTWRLGGNTCLAGDIIGDYSFDQPLKNSDRLILEDMAIYSMVKNNTFNGINLPAIVLYTTDKKIRIIKQFGYEDFKSRLS